MKRLKQANIGNNNKNNWSIPSFEVASLIVPIWIDNTKEPLQLHNTCTSAANTKSDINQEHTSWKQQQEINIEKTEATNNHWEGLITSPKPKQHQKQKTDKNQF